MPRRWEQVGPWGLLSYKQPYCKLQATNNRPQGSKPSDCKAYTGNEAEILQELILTNLPKSVLLKQPAWFKASNTRAVQRCMTHLCLSRRNLAGTDFDKFAEVSSAQTAMFFEASTTRELQRCLKRMRVSTCNLQELISTNLPKSILPKQP